jgi:hypothetical protein
VILSVTEQFSSYEWRKRNMFKCGGGSFGDRWKKISVMAGTGTWCWLQLNCGAGGSLEWGGGGP